MGWAEEQTIKKNIDICIYVYSVVLPKGNSGRSIKPCFPQSGVWKASGWDIRWAFSLAACKPSFISFTVSRQVSGSKWQLTPTIEAPRRRKITSSHISQEVGDESSQHSRSRAVHLTAALWKQGSWFRASLNSPEASIYITAALLFTFLMMNHIPHPHKVAFLISA